MEIHDTTSPVNVTTNVVRKSMGNMLYIYMKILKRCGIWMLDQLAQLYKGLYLWKFANIKN